MDRPSNNPKFQRPYVAPPKTKYIDKINLPEKKIDESLIQKLFLSIDEGNISKIKEFIQENNMLLNVKTDNGESPIQKIITSTNIINDDKLILIKYFLLRGASAISYDKYNITPIHLAVKYQLKDITELLIKYGANANSLDSNNMNTLHYAVMGQTLQCPVNLNEQFLVPKDNKKKYSKDTQIIQEISDLINQLFFKWVIPQVTFKNTYENINNYDNVYKKEIELKKMEFSKTLSEILSNKTIDLDRKKELIEKELLKISDDLKNTFISHIKDSMINLSEFYSYDEKINEIKINSDSFSPNIIENMIFSNLNKTQTEILELLNNIEIKNLENQNKLILLKDELTNIRWLNRTLVINYSWDMVNNISNKNGINIQFYNNGLKINNDKIPIDETLLDNIYKLDDDEIENFNLFFKEDKEKIQLSDFNSFDINTNGIFSSDIKKYERMTNKEFEENKRKINKNILSFDYTYDISKTDTLLTDIYYDGKNYKGQIFSFPFKFKTKTTDLNDYDMTDHVKRTFLKKSYIITDKIKEQIKILNYNFSIIDKFIKYYDSWNLLLHLIPSCLIIFVNILRLIKFLNDETKIYKTKFEDIKNLFIEKQKDNDTKNINHNWIYEDVIKSVDFCLTENQNINNYTKDIFNLMRNFIEKYNILIDQLSNLQGFGHIKKYHNNFNIDDTAYINREYLKERYFTNFFDDFKLNDIKNIDLIETDRAYYFDNIFSKIFNTTNNFYNDVKYKTDVDSNNLVLIKYPDNFDITPFNNGFKFMNLYKYNNPHNLIYENRFNFKNINFLIKTDNTDEKKNNNDVIIKNVLGNHFILQKYYLVIYFANLFTNNTTIFPLLQQKIKDDKVNEIVDKIKIKLIEYLDIYKNKLNLNINEFKTIHYERLVEIISETYDNFVEYLIKKKSLTLAHSFLDQYNIRDENIAINTPASVLYPIIKNDNDFINVGIKTKLTVEEILNIASEEYNNFIDNDIIKETNTNNNIYKSDDNICYKIDTELIKLLLNNNVNLGQKDNSNRIPISYALELKNLNIIESLIPELSKNYYKNSPEVIKYFNTLFIDTIEETIQNNNYDKFYNKYKHKLIKKLEAKPEINSNILSSIDYTIPMYMSLLNSMLFTNILNYNFGITQDDLNKLFNILNVTNQNKFFGPIVYQIITRKDLVDYSKKLQKDKLLEHLQKINAKINFEKNKEKQLLDTKNILDTKPNSIYKENRLKQIEKNKEDSDEYINSLSHEKIDIESKNINIEIPNTIKLNFDKESLKTTSSIYNKIFDNIINNKYDSNINVKIYKALWKNYLQENQTDYITNIHLVLLNNVLNDINSNYSENFNLYTKIFEVFGKLSKDYTESPNEFNYSNYNLQEILNLIIHTVTHTIFSYLYLTIVKMIIKQLEESYPKNTLNLDTGYDDFIINKLREILDDSTGNSKLIKFLLKEMPEKCVKIILNIYDGDADPDRNNNLDLLFEKLFRLIKTTKVINTDETSYLLNNLNSVIFPYYKEYIQIVILELYELTNNFFRHLDGINSMTKIYNKFN